MTGKFYEESFIFKDVVFYLNNVSSIIGEQLEIHGAIRANLPDDWSKLTHVITKDITGEIVHLAQKKGISIVNTNWVEASLRRKHLQNIKYFSADPRHFFTGFMILCVELPLGDENAIYEGVSAFGGQCTKVLSRSVTHIITLHMNHEICKQVLKRPDLGIKILLPHWFDDCLKHSRCVDETPYLFPNPSIFNADHNDEISNFFIPKNKLCLDSQDLDLNSSKFTKQLLKHKKILFSNDLEIGQRLRRTLEIVVISFGATIVSSIHDANVYIGIYREGDEYIQAARQGIIIGNLTWLYWMLVYKTWLKPEKNLLHYPIVRGGLPEMREMIITISNYQGESRQYLEKLIEALGATFTKNMKPNNTHLIIPCKSGQKYMAALEWNIHIVNHLWVEETYAKWKLQSITVPRYIYFPLQTNFMENVGNTPIDMDVIKLFYENPDCNFSNMEKSPFKESNLLEYSNNCLSNSDKLLLDSYSSPLESLSVTRVSSCCDNQSSFLSYDCNSSKENLPSFHKRRAATVALAKLHNEVMPDVLLYQKQCKRKTFSCLPKDLKNVRKKLKDVSFDYENRKNNEVFVRGVFREKSFITNKNSQNYDIRILVTGYSDWNNQIEKALLDLGINTVQDAKDCTHLIASRIQRTQKFLTALPYTPKILSTDWIEACLKEKKVVDESNYFLVDLESEMKYNFKLSESLKRASENKRCLFKGYLFQVSPEVVSNYNNGINTIKQIIEANGGICMLTNSRRNQIEYENFSFILISNSLDDKISKQFVEKRKQANQIPLIYNMEWVLTTILRQELKFTSENSLLG
ncbi:hypothetical protein PCANB_002779 [Pneumocystis canis]|nr:hypothetical protein PCK1_002951 [Pneumocystis canis]KAG5438291.1 hypothetical protein PCANB_002779 [Pneumocystis canis]